jgi:hypothetical protein
MPAGGQTFDFEFPAVLGLLLGLTSARNVA